MYFNPFSLWPLISGVGAGAIAAVAWRRRTTPVAAPFAGLMLAVALYAFGYAMELSSNRLDVMLFWIKVEYLGIPAIPFFWLITVLHYTGRRHWLTRRNIALLAVLPIITLLAHYTSAWHNLHYISPRLETSGIFPVIAFEGGALYWLGNGYYQAYILFAVVLLIRMLPQVARPLRVQVVIMMLGALPPWVSFTVYTLRLGIFAYVDPTPFSLALTGVLIAWGIFGHRLLSLLPVAQRAIIESLVDPVLVVDDRKKLVDCNPAALRLFSPAQPPIGETVMEFLADWPELLRALDSDAKRIIEIRHAAQEGDRFFEATIAPLADPASGQAGRVAILHEITTHRHAEESLRRSEKRFRDLVELLPVGVYETDGERRVTFLNRIALSMFEWSYDDIAAGKLKTSDVFPPDDQQNVQAQREMVFKNGVVQNLEFTALRRDGSLFPVIVHACAIEIGNPAAGTRGVVIDNTERKKLDEALHDAYLVAEESNRELTKVLAELDMLATTDKLTGAFNRRKFEEIIAYEIRQAVRYGRAFSLLIFDLDHFKRVNDTFGHQIGDKALVDTVEVVRQQTRQSDTLARWGGEEFTLLAPYTNLAQASKLAEKIREVIEKHLYPGGARITISIGVAEYHPADTPDSLLKRADDALYRAKQSGRNRVQLEA